MGNTVVHMHSDVTADVDPYISSAITTAWGRLLSSASAGNLPVIRFFLQELPGAPATVLHQLMRGDRNESLTRAEFTAFLSGASQFNVTCLRRVCTTHTPCLCTETCVDTHTRV
jgi:hypothetical protein